MMEDIILGVGSAFGFGALGGALFSLVGYLNHFVVKKAEGNVKANFNVQKFFSVMIIGGLAGVGLIYLKLDIEVVRELLVFAGVGAGGIKIANVVGTMWNSHRNKGEKLPINLPKSNKKKKK